MDQVVIANRLSDGVVVFLAAAPGSARGEWMLRLEDASVARDDARAQEILALGLASARDRNEVIDPYLIDVEQTPSGLRPTRYRELIRAFGPTVRQDLGKQSGSGEV